MGVAVSEMFTQASSFARDAAAGASDGLNWAHRKVSRSVADAANMAGLTSVAHMAAPGGTEESREASETTSESAPDASPRATEAAIAKAGAYAASFLPGYLANSAQPCAA